MLCLYTLAPGILATLSPEANTIVYFHSMAVQSMVSSPFPPFLPDFRYPQTHHCQVLTPSDSTPRVSVHTIPARNAYPYQRPASWQTRSYEQPCSLAFRGAHLLIDQELRIPLCLN